MIDTCSMHYHSISEAIHLFYHFCLIFIIFIIFKVCFISYNRFVKKAPLEDIQTKNLHNTNKHDLDIQDTENNQNLTLFKIFQKK